MPLAVRQTAMLWLCMFLAGSAALGVCATPPGRVWLAQTSGEPLFLPQIKALTDHARQVTRPRPDTADHIRTTNTVTAPYGVNTFLHHEVGQNRRNAVIGLARDAGFVYLRQPMPWQDVEIHARGDFVDRRNEPPRSAWFKYDNIVHLAQAQGMQVILRLDNPPAWTRHDGDARHSQAPPDDYADYAAFVAQVAQRYRGQIRHYQIWNEPNIYPEWGEQLVSPEDYARLLQQAAVAIRAVDPEAVIVLAALAATTAFDGDAHAWENPRPCVLFVCTAADRDIPVGGGLDDLVFLQRLYDAGAAPYFDVVAVQGYGLWSGPADRRMHPLVLNFGRARYVRDLMVRNGDGAKPLWIAEMNWNAVPEGEAAPFGRVSLAEQARYIPEAYRRLQAWPWVELSNVWYLKRAQPYWEQRGDPQAYFRLMTYDGQLMPVYHAIQAYLTDTVRGE